MALGPASPSPAPHDFPSFGTQPTDRAVLSPTAPPPSSRPSLRPLHHGWADRRVRSPGLAHRAV